jgi:hypothetical protein
MVDLELKLDPFFDEFIARYGILSENVKRVLPHSLLGDTWKTSILQSFFERKT